MNKVDLIARLPDKLIKWADLNNESNPHIISYLQQYYLDCSAAQMLDFNINEQQILNTAIKTIQKQLSYILINKQKYPDWFVQWSKQIILNQEWQLVLFGYRTSYLTQLLTRIVSYTYYKTNPNEHIMRQNKENCLYENRLPHTRSNIIFIPIELLQQPIQHIINTLIHEQCHIVQRRLQNSEFMVSFLQCIGFNKIGTISNQYKRSNPDTNNTIYKDQNGDLCLNIYRNQTPNSISDTARNVNNIQLYQILGNTAIQSNTIQYNNLNKLHVLRDHPFEQLAYKYSDIIIELILSNKFI